MRWWDTTGYFPGVPGKQNPSTAQDDFDDANFPVFRHIDLDNGMKPSAADFTSLFSDGLQANSNGPPDPDDHVDSTPISPAPPPSPPPAADTCGDWYKFFFDHFEIKGKNSDASKLGTGGSGLKQKIQGMWRETRPPPGARQLNSAHLSMQRLTL